MKRVFFICSLFFVVANGDGLGANETKVDFFPLVDVLSDINAGQKVVVLIDIGTELSFRDELRNAYLNESVSMFWVHFGEDQQPQIASEIEAVGDVVAEIITNLYDEDLIERDNLELVCYGPGCHAAGIIGRKLKERRINGEKVLIVSTIFALNPVLCNCQMNTELNDANSPQKLQPEDANEVVVLHTNRTIVFEENYRDGTHNIYLNSDDNELDKFANELFAKLITNSSLHLIPYDFNNNKEPIVLTQIYSMKEFLSKPGWYTLDKDAITNLHLHMTERVPKPLCQFINHLKPDKDVNFELFSHIHRQNPKTIKANQFNELGNEYFNKSWPTKFIIHGFLSGNNDIDDLAVAFSNDLYGSRTEPLNYENLISVNWRKGARFYYACAHQYVKDVGEYAGQFIYNAVISQKMELSTVEVIGHSLGAHIAGWIGKHLEQLSGNKLVIPRIVALDPAGPCFSYVNFASCTTTRTDLELKHTDATEVIVLHTNSRKWSLVCEGYWGLLGTADIFLNGGMLQRNMVNIYSHIWAPVYYRFVMNMENPLIGYTFTFSKANSLSAINDAQRERAMKANYMHENHQVEIFHGASPLNLRKGEAIYIDTYSKENSVPRLN